MDAVEVDEVVDEVVVDEELDGVVDELVGAALVELLDFVVVEVEVVVVGNVVDVVDVGGGGAAVVDVFGCWEVVVLVVSPPPPTPNDHEPYTTPIMSMVSGPGTKNSNSPEVRSRPPSGQMTHCESYVHTESERHRLQTTYLVNDLGLR